jgi:hypothetical protein
LATVGLSTGQAADDPTESVTQALTHTSDDTAEALPDALTDVAEGRTLVRR